MQFKLNFKCLQASWTSSTHPEGFLRASYKTNLYLDCGRIECEVLSRTCEKGKCVLHWDGFEDSIFQLSRFTCAGYEIGKC